MDIFKIIVLIFMILVTYQFYLLNCNKTNEPFADTQQSIGGVDDQNSINTLAQLAKQLMTGGATVPGNMTIKGELVASGSLTSAGITTGGITTRNIAADSGGIIYVLNSMAASGNVSASTINLPGVALTTGNGYLMGNGKIYQYVM